MAQFTPITPEMAMDVSGFSIVGEPRQKILYRVNDRGYTRTYGIDGRTFAPIKLPDFARFGPVDHIYPGSSTRDGRYTSFGIETAAPVTFTIGKKKPSLNGFYPAPQKSIPSSLWGQVWNPIRRRMEQRFRCLFIVLPNVTKLP
jgi:hypothetical protein